MVIRKSRETFAIDLTFLRQWHARQPEVTSQNLKSAHMLAVVPFASTISHVCPRMFPHLVWPVEILDWKSQPRLACAICPSVCLLKYRYTCHLAGKHPSFSSVCIGFLSTLKGFFPSLFCCRSKCLQWPKWLSFWAHVIRTVDRLTKETYDF